MQRILVSACLLGQNVRYDGKHNLQSNLILNHWQSEGRIISLCPEVAGGLSIPRVPAERQGNRVFTQNRIEVTAAFESGARAALELCQHHHIRIAVLKESSPSCGSTLIHDGTFHRQKIPGQGITTELLRNHGIFVFNELQWEQAQQKLVELESIQNFPNP